MSSEEDVFWCFYDEFNEDCHDRHLRQRPASTFDGHLALVKRHNVTLNTKHKTQCYIKHKTQNTMLH